VTFTYTLGDSADQNMLRLELGDTDEPTALFADEELTDIIAAEVSLMASAARCCEILATRFARQFSFSADGLSAQKGQLADAYRKRALDYRRRVGSTSETITRVDGYSSTVKSDAVSAKQTVVDLGD